MSASASTSETASLLPKIGSDSQTHAVTSKPATPPVKPQRSVTFSPDVSDSKFTRNAPSQFNGSTVASAGPTSRSVVHSNGQPILSSLNSKIKRRNSHGTPNLLPLTAAPKIGPQRTTRTAQKLKLLPDPEHQLDETEENGGDVYTQFKHIKDPTARRDAARLGKEDRKRLPRVTAYCTASSYRMEGLMRYLKGRTKDEEAMPKRIDECIYTPYRSGRSAVRYRSPAESRSIRRRYSDSMLSVDEQTDDNDDNYTYSSGDHGNLDLDTTVEVPEVFLFEYGTVVIWGMTLAEEKRFLKEIAKFEVEKLSKDDVQIEDFNFYYTREYQARIYNDFISLREKKSSMTKLAISHALAQSVKV